MGYRSHVYGRVTMFTISPKKASSAVKRIKHGDQFSVERRIRDSIESVELSIDTRYPVEWPEFAADMTALFDALNTAGATFGFGEILRTGAEFGDAERFSVGRCGEVQHHVARLTWEEVSGAVVNLNDPQARRNRAHRRQMFY